jgi:F1F0 ATPase subunit 2
MTETLTLYLSGVGGLALGAFFFGGLWWTVRKGIASPRPALWFLGSLLVRTSVVMAGFYYIGQSNWQRLMASLAGFIVARFAVSRVTRSSEKGEERNAS